MSMKNLAARLSNLAPGVETVTLYSRQASGNETSFLTYTVPRARRRFLTKAEQIDRSLDMIMAQRTLIWEMWKQILDANAIPEPKVNDQILDANGTYWTVVSPVSLMLYKQLYNCQCQAQAP